MLFSLPVSIILLFSVLLARADHQEELPTVQIGAGTLQGKIVRSHNEKQVEAFIGVPYAKPPIKDLRFSPPQPTPPWEGVRSAHSHGYECPQPEYQKREYGMLNKSEDCLYLNVWTQHPRPNNAAVLVFFHGKYGDQFRIGSSAWDKYDGAQLAEEQGLVVVTANFRFDTLGLLYLGIPEAPGNVGLMDQALVLKWVRENVGHFGGDPKKVTAFGDDLGGLYVGYQALIPSGRGLFQNIIMLDGFPNMRGVTDSPKFGLAKSYRLAGSLGCDTATKNNSKILSCLREKPIKELVMTALFTMAMKLEFFYPVADGSYISFDPAAPLEFDTEINYMMGISHRKGALGYHWVTNTELDDVHYINRYQFRSMIKTMLKKTSGLALEGAIDEYTDWEHPDKPSSLRKNAVDFMSDLNLLCPAVYTANNLAASGNKVYVFYFSERSSKSRYPKWAGVIEGQPIDYIFGHAHPSLNYTEEDHQLSHHVMEALGNFARSGNPNKVGEDSWEHYYLREQAYYEVKIGGKNKHHLRSDKCAFWKKTYKRLQRADELIAMYQSH